MNYPIGQSPQAIHCRITRELSRLTVTTGYLVKQVYADGSTWPIGRRRTIKRAKDLRDSCKSHFGNHFKIVRLYRRVRGTELSKR